MDKDMLDREKVMKGLEVCTAKPGCCTDCPYKKTCTQDSQEVMEDALALLKEQEEKIKSLTEDIEVWKKRYKFMVLECKSSDDPNKEPAIVKYYTTEEVEQGKAVAFSND